MKNTKLMNRFNCPIPLSTLASQLASKSQSIKFTEVLMENLILKSGSSDGKIKMQKNDNFYDTWKKFSFQIINLINTEYFIQVTYLISQKNPTSEKFFLFVNIHYQSQYVSNVFAEAVFINDSEQMINKYDSKLQNTIIIHSQIERIDSILRNLELFNSFCPKTCNYLGSSTHYLKLGDTINFLFDKEEQLVYTLSLIKLEKTEDQLVVGFSVKRDGEPKVSSSNPQILLLEWVGKKIANAFVELTLNHYSSQSKNNIFESFINEKEYLMKNVKKYAEQCKC